MDFPAVRNSCRKTPAPSSTPTNFFNSESDARQSLTGTYAILKNNSLYGQLGLDTYYESGADILEPNRAFRGCRAHRQLYAYRSLGGSVDPAHGRAQYLEGPLQIVLNVNTLLDALNDNTTILAATKEELTAEALFLRSLAYYHLTNLWGDVPYYRDALSIEEISVLGRTEADLIRREILEDLEVAQQSMPSSIAAHRVRAGIPMGGGLHHRQASPHSSGLGRGRDKCLEIINDSPHQLAPTFAEVFNPLNEYNQEIIWELDYEKNVVAQFEQGRPDLPGNGNWYASMFNPRLRDEPKNTEDKDRLIAALDANGEAFTGTGLQVPIPDFINSFPENDLRAPLNIQDTYAGIQLNFAYMPKLWNLNVEQSPRFNHSDNKLVYRLADVYLMAAEAENELNGPAEAYQYINPYAPGPTLPRPKPSSVVSPRQVFGRPSATSVSGSWRRDPAPLRPHPLGHSTRSRQVYRIPRLHPRRKHPAPPRAAAHPAERAPPQSGTARLRPYQQRLPLGARSYCHTAQSTNGKSTRSRPATRESLGAIKYS